ncbi:acetate--CoA ligase family protein, partial [candidate division WOR-3 bacterium]|nr:acetate--CoA ligase family protein [candidate division WOR-3 bacterium]
MKIHEYQAKQIFKKAGILVPEGNVATNIEKAISTSEEIGLPVVIKAQVHVGGRGKAGGVKIAKTPEEVKKFAGEILGMDIKGLTVKKILVGKAIDIQRELYLGVITDRSTNHPVIMVSTEGGVDIEEVAKKTPEKIHRFTVDPAYGLLVHHAMNLAFKLSSDVKEVREIASTLQKLYKTYLDSDASLAEINPYVLSADSNFYAIDAKIVLDDNALFRHPDYEEMRDLTL